jgi:hypothetical protein
MTTMAGAPEEGTFAVALDRAIRRRQVTLAWLQDRLHRRGVHVSKSTLSYWRRGQRLPERRTSLDVLHELEDVLGLPDLYLVSRLGPSRRQRRETTVRYDRLIGRPAPLPELMAQLGVADPEALVAKGSTLLIDVDADHRICRSLHRLVWRARCEGVRSMPVVLGTSDPPPEPPTVRAVSGCRLGRQAYDRASGYLAAELVLDRPLRIGETAITEHAFEGRHFGSSHDSWYGIAERRTEHGLLWVRFDPAALPSYTEAVECPDGGAESVRPVELVGSTLHVEVANFGPGYFGLRWEW